MSQSYFECREYTNTCILLSLFFRSDLFCVLDRNWANALLDLLVVMSEIEKITRFVLVRWISGNTY